MSQTKINRKYKDTVFRALFKDKENLLSLYNALNDSNYTNLYSLVQDGTLTKEQALEKSTDKELLKEMFK